jgi:putative oxidoreductase
VTTTRFANWPGHAFLALPVRLYLAAVFGVACFHKILDPAAFALDVATYQMLPVELVHPFALVLPWVEAATAGMLALGLRTRTAAFLCAGMMAMFLVALAAALYRGLDMSCGCFASAGAQEDPISGATLLRDAAWFALAAYVFFFDRRPLGLDRLFPRPAAAPAPDLAGDPT